MKLFLTTAVVSLLLLQSANATPLVLDLTNGGLAGPALEASGTITDSGVTINATATGGDLNSLSGSFGVDGPETAATDDSDQIDNALGEGIEFEFVFSDLLVEITELDFIGVGAADGDDAILFAINSNAPTVLETGVTGFNGSTDVFNPPTPISLSSGDVLTLTAEDVAGIQSITLNVAAIPEPNSIVIALLAGVAGCSRRSP